VTRRDRQGAGETYLEILQVGGSFRVAAIDVETGEEVVFQAPLKTPRPDIERLAIAKLARKLGRMAPGADENTETPNKKRPDGESGRDIKV
jgi:hypothetical protein